MKGRSLRKFQYTKGFIKINNAELQFLLNVMNNAKALTLNFNIVST